MWQYLSMLWHHKGSCSRGVLHSHTGSAATSQNDHHCTHNGPISYPLPIFPYFVTPLIGLGCRFWKMLIRKHGYEKLRQFLFPPESSLRHRVGRCRGWIGIGPTSPRMPHHSHRCSWLSHLIEAGLKSFKKAVGAGGTESTWLEAAGPMDFERPPLLRTVQVEENTLKGENWHLLRTFFSSGEK